MTKTSFAKWREKVGFSQDEAARALGKTTRMVQYWERGVGSDGKKAVPPDEVRRVMWAIAKNIKLDAWPE